MMSSDWTLRLNRRNALSIDSPSCNRISAKSFLQICARFQFQLKSVVVVSCDGTDAFCPRGVSTSRCSKSAVFSEAAAVVSWELVPLVRDMRFNLNAAWQSANALRSFCGASSISARMRIPLWVRLSITFYKNLQLRFPKLRSLGNRWTNLIGQSFTPAHRTCVGDCHRSRTREAERKMPRASQGVTKRQLRVTRVSCWACWNPLKLVRVWFFGDLERFRRCYLLSRRFRARDAAV